jgi:hypothetical protein
MKAQRSDQYQNVQESCLAQEGLAYRDERNRGLQPVGFDELTYTVSNEPRRLATCSKMRNSQ